MLILIFFFTLSAHELLGQIFHGKTVDKDNGNPIAYVNIGIKNRNIGTVSDSRGQFSIELDGQYDNDTLFFSCVGYHPFGISVQDLKAAQSIEIRLEEKVVALREVLVQPRDYIRKTLGIKARSKSIAIGFEENRLGYECGILIKVKTTAILETLNLNIASCSYDTVFYRVNFYSLREDGDFENFLQKPIYFEISKDKIGDKIAIDLKEYNIHVEGDFLVTVEHVKDLGMGHLYFCAGLSKKTYYRKTSQGDWESVPIGVGINIDAQVER